MYGTLPQVWVRKPPSELLINEFYSCLCRDARSQREAEHPDQRLVAACVRMHGSLRVALSVLSIHAEKRVGGGRSFFSMGREEGCLQAWLWRPFVVCENKTKWGEDKGKEWEKKERKRGIRRKEGEMERAGGVDGKKNLRVRNSQQSSLARDRDMMSG